MAKKFYLVNRETGVRFKSSKEKYVVLYDSGFPAFVEQQYYTYIEPVDLSVWELRYKKQGEL